MHKHEFGYECYENDKFGKSVKLYCKCGWLMQTIPIQIKSVDNAPKKERKVSWRPEPEKLPDVKPVWVWADVSKTSGGYLFVFSDNTATPDSGQYANRLPIYKVYRDRVGDIIVDQRATRATRWRRLPALK